MIRTVIFDIDDTLYSFCQAHEAAFPEVCRLAEATLGVDGEEFRRRYDGMMDRQRQRSGEVAAIHSRTIRFQMMLEDYGLSLGQTAALDDFYWGHVLLHSVPGPGVRDCFDQLKAAGIKIGICTDMTLYWQLRKLERLGLLEQVDFLVSSEEAGVEKPEEGIFRLCQEKAGCKAEECLFLGDSLKKDVLGALAYGFHALWFRPEGDGEERCPEVTSIRSVGEVPAYCGL